MSCRRRYHPDGNGNGSTLGRLRRSTAVSAFTEKRFCHPLPATEHSVSFIIFIPISMSTRLYEIVFSRRHQVIATSTRHCFTEELIISAKSYSDGVFRFPFPCSYLECRLIRVLQPVFENLLSEQDCNLLYLDLLRYPTYTRMLKVLRFCER